MRPGRVVLHIWVLYKIKYVLRFWVGCSLVALFSSLSLWLA